MKQVFDQVGDFNSKFEVPENEFLSPAIPDDNKFLYHHLIKEEVEEYMDAIIARDDVEVADALTDILYLVVGAFRKHGIPFEVVQACFDEVHLSNLSKLGEDGKPIFREDGKVIKGPNYFKPDLKTIIDNYKHVTYGS